MARGTVKAIALTAACLLALTACGGAAKSEREAESKSVFAMDTVMDVTAYGERAREAVDAAEAELYRLDALLSTGRPESDIARVNARAAGDGPCAVRAETAELVSRALACCAETDGALDVTVYPAMQAWGFDTGEHRVPAQEELDALLARVDYAAVTVKDNTITVPEGVALDLGAVGKGYAADRIVSLWREMGVTSGLLSLGGNVHCLGAKPDGSDWRVGVRDPADENGILCTVSGRDMAVVTSGAYQRNFTRDGVTYHHILDPATCAPARSGLASASIVADSGFVCDGLSTAVYVMGLDLATEFWRERKDFDMVLYTDAGELCITPGLADRLTPAEGVTLRVLDE